MSTMKFINNHPLVVRFVLFVFLPLMFLLLWIWLHLRVSLPAAGQYSVDYISHEVELHTDERGVVHINAATDNDAYFALGYAHASDRLWQLEIQRRMAAGRLSEILGKRAIDQDAWLRTLGLRKAAESSWKSLSADAQNALRAYTRGINNRIDQLEVLPPEFLLLGVRPEPWHELDSLAWMKVFALNMAGNMWSELGNFVSSQWLSPQQLASLVKGYPKDGVVTVAAEKNVASLSRLFTYQQQLQQLDIGGRVVGSNAWVVAGAHTESGQAMLANDPHLGLQMPSFWYVADMQGDRLDVTGMTLVGLPLVIFGRNAHIAWGGTNMMADVQDLKLEQSFDQDTNRYLAESGWRDFEIREEIIEVKAEAPSKLRAPIAPVKLDVRSTENGPVISDLINGLDQVVSLRWTALDEDDTTFEAFYRLGYAENWQQFKAALSLHVAPALNMLYIDKNNNIGYQGAGRIPLRSEGEGMLPTSGADERYKWRGYIPFDQLPTSFNPTQGYLVSANNKVVSDEYPYFISNEWAEPARAARITQLLEQKLISGKKIGSRYSMEMQNDQTDLSLISMRDYLLSISNQLPIEYRPQIALLENWDGRTGSDDGAVALLHVWVKYLRQELYLKYLGKKWGKAEEYRLLQRVIEQTSSQQIIKELRQAKLWCSHQQVSTKQQALPLCIDVVVGSLELALKELDLFLGSDPDEWKWGDMHEASLSHMPMSQFNLINRFFSRDFKSGGSPNSLNVSNAKYVDLEGYKMSFGAGFRQVISIGDSGFEHHYITSSGQSGNPLSKHYDDSLKAYANGEFYQLMDNFTPVVTRTLLAPKRK